MVKIFYLTGLYWLWLVIVIIIFDISSKHWIMTNMTLHETKPLILPFLNLFYVHNYGAIFSFLADKNGWQRWFFISISTVIVLALLFTMYCNHVSKTFINIAHALFIGGAIGNLFDRIYYGYVIDFIDFYISKWHFATFNIADCSIFMGAILLILDEWFIGKKHIKKDEKIY